MNKEIKNDMDFIMTHFGGSILRNTNLDPLPLDDIDILIPQKKYFDMSCQFLQENGYTLKEVNISKNTYLKSYNGEVYQVELYKDFQYIFMFFPSINFTNTFNKKLLLDFKKNEEIFNVIRYIYLLRPQKKYTKYIKNILMNHHISTYLNKENISDSIFRNNKIKFSRVEKCMQRSIFYLFISLKPKYFIQLIVSYIFITWGILGTGKIYCILGPDGVGKTTVTKKIINASGRNKYYYMGNKDIFDRGGMLRKILIGIGVIIINIYLYVAMKFYTILGYNIITDRWPNYEGASTSKTNKKFIDIAYYFYPAPHHIIVLHESSDNIRKRKKELSIENIDIQNLYFSTLPYTLRIKNTNLDTTLNQIIKLIYR